MLWFFYFSPFAVIGVIDFNTSNVMVLHKNQRAITSKQIFQYI